MLKTKEIYLNFKNKLIENISDSQKVNIVRTLLNFFVRTKPMETNLFLSGENLDKDPEKEKLINFSKTYLLDQLKNASENCYDLILRFYADHSEESYDLMIYCLLDLIERVHDDTRIDPQFIDPQYNVNNLRQKKLISALKKIVNVFEKAQKNDVSFDEFDDDDDKSDDEAIKLFYIPEDIEDIKKQASSADFTDLPESLK